MFGGLNEITEDLYTNNSTFGGGREKKRRRWEAKTNTQNEGRENSFWG